MTKQVEAQFFAIVRMTDHEFYTIYDVAGTGPRWSVPAYAKRFDSEADAQAAIDNMHPEYRARHLPEVFECQLYDTGEIGVS